MRRFFLLLLPLIIVLSGCGLAQKAVDKAAEKALEKATGVTVDEKNNTVTVKGQDGQSVTMQSTEAKLPADFPLKVVTGGKVTSGSVMKSNDKRVWTVEITFEKDPKAVADYYEKALTDQGLKIDRVDSETNGETTIMLSGESDKMSTWTTITWSEQDKGKVGLMLGEK